MSKVFIVKKWFKFGHKIYKNDIAENSVNHFSIVKCFEIKRDANIFAYKQNVLELLNINEDYLSEFITSTHISDTNNITNQSKVESHENISCTDCEFCCCQKCNNERNNLLKQKIKEKEENNSIQEVTNRDKLKYPSITSDMTDQDIQNLLDFTITELHSKKFKNYPEYIEYYYKVIECEILSNSNARNENLSNKLTSLF